MGPEKINLENTEKKEDFLLLESKYEEDESEEFDKHLHSRSHLTARQEKFTPETPDEILFSDWHVPCHSILTRTADGKYQLFHVQPNNPGATLLSVEQEKELKKLADRQAESIIAKSKKSWFDPGDAKELEKMNIKNRKIIDVDTFQWWRLLYDPKINEVWIDIKDKKTLRKYRGF